MKKILAISLSLLFTSIVFGQKAKYELQLKKNYRLDFVRTAEDGSHVIGIKKNLLSSKAQDYRIIRFDKDLKVSYDKKVGSPNFLPITVFSKAKFTEKILSKDGSYMLMGESMIDKEGNAKAYDFFNNNGYPVSGDVDSFFISFTGNYLSAFGVKKGRKHKKKVYVAGDLRLFTRDNTDFSEHTYSLDFPDVGFYEKNNEDKKLSLLDQEAFNDGFYLIADDNDDKNEDKVKYQSNDFYVANYGYDGKLISKAQLNYTLENSYFLTSLSGGYLTRKNLYIDNINKTYFVFGTYTDKKEKKLYLRAKYKGFYVSKFNKDGLLLWQKEFPITDEDFRKAKAPNLLSIHTWSYGANNLMISLLDYDYKNKSWILNVNKETGALTSSVAAGFDKKGVRDGQNIIRMFKVDDFKKFIFDKAAFDFMKINTDFYDYLKTLPNKKTTFEGYYFELGDIMIYQKNSKKNSYTLLKF